MSIEWPTRLLILTQKNRNLDNIWQPGDKSSKPIVATTLSIPWRENTVGCLLQVRVGQPDRQQGSLVYFV